MVRATSFSTRLPEYDVPVVDKAVDATWKREQPRKTPLPPKGLFLLILSVHVKDFPVFLLVPDICILSFDADSSLKTATRPSDSSLDKIVATLMACLMAIVMLVRSVKDLATKRLPYKTESEESYSTLYPDSTKEEFRPPSPTPGFAEADLFAAVLQRLGELEEKVQMLQEKPSEMPCEKEELLNAAVRRVDALEAELIVTKKVISN